MVRTFEIKHIYQPQKKEKRKKEKKRKNFEIKH